MTNETNVTAGCILRQLGRSSDTTQNIPETRQSITNIWITGPYALNPVIQLALLLLNITLIKLSFDRCKLPSHSNYLTYPETLTVRTIFPFGSANILKPLRPITQKGETVMDPDSDNKNLMFDFYIKIGCRINRELLQEDEILRKICAISIHSHYILILSSVIWVEIALKNYAMFLKCFPKDNFFFSNTVCILAHDMGDKGSLWFWRVGHVVGDRRGW